MTARQNRLYEELRYLRDDLFNDDSEEMLFDILTVLPFVVEDVKYEREK